MFDEALMAAFEKVPHFPAHPHPSPLPPRGFPPGPRALMGPSCTVRKRKLYGPGRLEADTPPSPFPPFLPYLCSNPPIHHPAGGGLGGARGVLRDVEEDCGLFDLAEGDPEDL